jgi:hypothetical protein
MYTPSWFLTLFSKSLSNEKFYRFFECFLVEGYPVIFKTALALLKLKEKLFLSNSMEENLMLVNDMTFYEQVSDDEFISHVFSFEVTAQEISAIEKEYSLKNKSTMKKLEDAVEKAYTKKMSEPRVVFEWTLEDYRSLNVNLVDFS